MMKKLLLIALISFVSKFSFAVDPIVVKNYVKASFAIANKDKVSSIIISDNDFAGVKRAGQDLQLDIEKVTSLKPEMLSDKFSKIAIIIGTIGQSKIIDQLIRTNKINVAERRSECRKHADTNCLMTLL